MKKSYLKAIQALNRLKDIPLLVMRILLAYGFFGPAMMKVNNLGEMAIWFEGMGIPFPSMSAFLAAYTELTGAILLALGLASRFISIPLMIVMAVAISTVHWGQGFEAGDNGFEIPLYYLAMLLMLLISGPGRISLDFLLGNLMGKHHETSAAALESA